jgi:hypothetical protein
LRGKKVALRRPGPLVQPALIEWAGRRVVDYLLANAHTATAPNGPVRCTLGYAGLLPVDLKRCPDRKALASIH